MLTPLTLKGSPGAFSCLFLPQCCLRSKPIQAQGFTVSRGYKSFKTQRAVHWATGPAAARSNPTSGLLRSSTARLGRRGRAARPRRTLGMPLPELKAGVVAWAGNGAAEGPRQGRQECLARVTRAPARQMRAQGRRASPPAMVAGLGPLAAPLVSAAHGAATPALRQGFLAQAAGQTARLGPHAAHLAGTGA